MYKPNNKHKQTDLFGFANYISREMAKEMQESEEQKFYDLIFCKIKEEDFACLYSETGSRPNAPINCLVAALLLLNKKRLTYERLFEDIKFNLLTKVALGLQTLDEAPFSEATIFNFQNRLISHYAKTGENLLEKVFDHLTQEQLKELRIGTNIQRTDSFQAVSNIRRYTRLQLLIEIIIRVYWVLSEEDKKEYDGLFSAYTKKSSGQYIYRLTQEEVSKEFEVVGKVYKEINDKLRCKYEGVEIFRIFERVYLEHFTVVKEKVSVRSAEELTSSMIQSPDDIEATYREKRGEEYQGQAVNIVETCNPDNQINLITDISVHANNIDESKALNERIDIIKEKTPELNEFHFDGGYSSSENDKGFEKHSITSVQTAIRGREPNGVEIKIERVGEKHPECEQPAIDKNETLEKQPISEGSCSNFQENMEVCNCRKGVLQRYIVSCPNQTVKSQCSKKRFKAELKICSTCAYSSKCQLTKKKGTRVYYFTSGEYLKKKRINEIGKIPKERRGLRANVEATVCEFKRKMNNGKLKVRGLFKAQIFAYTVGIVVNFGRIYRYLEASKFTMATERS